MAQKKGQFSLEEIDTPVSKGKGQFSFDEVETSKPVPYSDPTLKADQLDSGSVADIANPIASASGSSTTSLPRAALNLVGALGEGAEKALGIDPNNQLSSLGKMAQRGQRMSLDEPRPSIGSTLSGLYHGIVDSPAKMRTGLINKDPDEFVSGLGGTAATTGPALGGLAEITPKNTAQLARDAWQAITDTTPVKNPVSGEVVGPPVKQPKTGMLGENIEKTDFAASNPPSFAAKMSKALGGDKAYWLRDKLENTIQAAMPDLKAGEAEILNGQVQSAEELHRMLPEIKQKIRAEYETYLDKGKPISGDELVKRAVSGVDQGTRINHPAEYGALVNQLQEKYSGRTYSPREADSMLSSLNAESKAFYKQSNIDAAKSGKLIATAKWEAPASALRTLIDESLPDGGGAVRRRYGNIAEITEEMPSPNDEGEGAIKGIAKKTAGAMSTRPGYALLRGAMRYLGSTNSDQLIRQAFKEAPYTGSPKTTPPNSHPMAPTQANQGPHPLVQPQHPMSVGDIMTGIPESSTRMPSQNPIPQSQPRPAIPAQLGSVNQGAQPLPASGVNPIPRSQGAHPMTGLPINQSQPLPVNEVNPISQSTQGHPMQGLPVQANQPPLPHQVQGNPIQASNPGHPMTGLPVTQNQPPLPSQVRPVVPESAPIGRPAPLGSGQGGYPTPTGPTRGPKTGLSQPQRPINPSIDQYLNRPTQPNVAVNPYATGAVGKTGDVRYSQNQPPLPPPIQTGLLGQPKMMPPDSMLKKVGNKIKGSK